MRDAILDAGFNVTSHPPANLDSQDGVFSVDQTHLKTCCIPGPEVNTPTHGQASNLPQESGNPPSPSPLTLQKIRPNSVYTPRSQIPCESNVTLLDAGGQSVLPGSGPYRITLSVGGMTCSACSTAVTNALSELSGVTDVCVSLISNSAALVIDDKVHADSIVNVIEDCGFEVQIVKTESLHPPAGEKSRESNHRTISLRVDGMFSQYVRPIMPFTAVIDLVLLGVAQNRS
jgi:copper chaperone CopZ